MGASGWYYFVPYQADVAAALAALRDDVFAHRDFLGGDGRAKDAKTIEEALEISAEGGTHSVLDVSRVVETAHPPSMEQWSRDLGSPSAAQQTSYFQKVLDRHGTVAPVDLGKIGHDAAEQQARALCGQCHRGTGVYVTVYDDAGAPSEILFAGKSGD